MCSVITIRPTKPSIPPTHGWSLLAIAKPQDRDTLLTNPPLKHVRDSPVLSTANEVSPSVAGVERGPVGRGPPPLARLRALNAARLPRARTPLAAGGRRAVHGGDGSFAYSHAAAAARSGADGGARRMADRRSSLIEN